MFELLPKDKNIPDVVCAKRNLEFSERLSGLLDSSSELLQRGRLRERHTVNMRLLKESPVMSLLILLSSMLEATYTLHFPSHLTSDSWVEEAPQLLDVGVRRVLHLEPFLRHQTQHSNIIS